MARDKQNDPKSKLGTQTELRSLTGSGALVKRPAAQSQDVIRRSGETKGSKPTE
jgi:hypothetical protein